MLLAGDRPQVARAPLRDGLPPGGRRPARVRPARPAGRVPARGLRHVPQMLEGIKEEAVGFLFNLEVQVERGPAAGRSRDPGRLGAAARLRAAVEIRPRASNSAPPAGSGPAILRARPSTVGPARRGRRPAAEQQALRRSAWPAGRGVLGGTGQTAVHPGGRAPVGPGVADARRRQPTRPGEHRPVPQRAVPLRLGQEVQALPRRPRRRRLTQHLTTARPPAGPLALSAASRGPRGDARANVGVPSSRPFRAVRQQPVTSASRVRRSRTGSQTTCRGVQSQLSATAFEAQRHRPAPAARAGEAPAAASTRPRRGLAHAQATQPDPVGRSRAAGTPGPRRTRRANSPQQVVRRRRDGRRGAGRRPVAVERPPRRRPRSGARLVAASDRCGRPAASRTGLAWRTGRAPGAGRPGRSAAADPGPAGVEASRSMAR